jgi:hypothetical protein
MPVVPSTTGIFFHGSTAVRGPRPRCPVFEITHTDHALGRTPGRVISPSQRPLPDSTELSHETDIHALAGIRTRNPSKLAAAGIGHSGYHPKQITRNIRVFTSIIPCIMICYSCGNANKCTDLHSIYCFF